MKEGAEIVEKLIDKTLDGKVKWEYIPQSSSSTICFAKVKITDNKYMTYRIGKTFHKGRYENTLTIKLISSKLSLPIAILFANRYIRIYDLVSFIREGL